MASTLDLTLLYLFAAVVGVVLCRLMKLPPMLGYLAVGVVIGPNALALAKDSAGVRYLAEFGVVFLMFVIGLEFNLPKLKSMRSLVFGLGLGQVGLTIVATLLGHLALGSVMAWLGQEGGLLGWGIHWQSAVALGGALAMSSTAIVVKMMADRLELETEHGRRVMGILLFQDLAVVPLLVLIPALGDGASEMTRTLVLASVKAGALLVALLAGGQRVMHLWFDLVARRKSEELFMLNVLLVTLGLAWLTEHFGLSLALGAFVAGMLIAETDYKHQVETDIRPFHDVLLGLFFITIGMKLDWHSLIDSWALVLVLATLPVVFKLGLVTALAKAFGAPTGVALRTGLYLAQAGEFGFVLVTLAADHHLIPARVESPLLAAMVLSMLATPLIIQYSNRIVMRVSSTDWLMQSLAMTKIATRSINADRHVIICGYGRSGQNLARLLEQEGIPYMALDLDPDRVRQAAAAGQSVVFGDAAKVQSLMAAGLARASAVVVSYHDTPSALKILHLVQTHAPQVPVIVRTIDDSDLERLRAAQGVLSLLKHYGPARLEAACARAMAHGSPYYRTVKTIMATGADRRTSTVPVSPRTVMLPNDFFGAYEALAARLAGAAVGTVIPMYVAPTAEVQGTVTAITPQRLQTPDALVLLKHYSLTVRNPAGNVIVDVGVKAE